MYNINHSKFLLSHKNEVNNLGESPEQKKRTVKNDSLRWAIQGLNLGPPDYESVALTN